MTHRTIHRIEVLQPLGIGPAMFGFAGDPQANYFYGQAVSEVGVIAATDWDAA